MSQPARLQGLSPIVSANTRLLVLGSFPSAASLASQQYYAHPQNHFWKILLSIWPVGPHGTGIVSYEKRSKWLLHRGVGVWDVYASCEREGSLDAAIRNAEVNDFADLLGRCPDLQAIAFNGAESFKHAPRVLASLSTGRRAEPVVPERSDVAGLPMATYKLPSTSPANASWSFDRKLAAWREVVIAAGLA